MTSIPELLAVLAIGGFTALVVGIGYAAALHRERELHDATSRQLRIATDRWTQAEAAHLIALADLHAHGINGAMRRHPAGTQPAGLRVVK